MQYPQARLAMTLLIAVAALGAAVLGINRVIGERQAVADRERCRQNLSQLALALRAYREVHGAFPPGTLLGEALPPERRLSWVPLILNWTDSYQNIHFLFEPDHPWDSRENLRPRVKIGMMGDGPDRIEESHEAPWFPLRCPAMPTELAAGMPDPLHYVGIAGLGADAPTLPEGHHRAGVFGYDRQTRPEAIRDGASQTMILAETTSEIGPWTAGGPASVRGLDPGRRPYLGRGHPFGGAHRGGAMVAFADGSVWFLREAIDERVFESLATVAGGETLPAGWDR